MGSDTGKLITTNKLLSIQNYISNMKAGDMEGDGGRILRVELTILSYMIELHFFMLPMKHK